MTSTLLEALVSAGPAVGPGAAGRSAARSTGAPAPAADAAAGLPSAVDPSSLMPATREESLSGEAADLSARWSRDLAVLVVERAGDGFAVHGRHSELGLDRVSGEHYGIPNLKLGDVAVQGGLPPGEVLSLLVEWSRPHFEITRWVNQLRARVGDRLHLVVWDDTGSGIPWELLWLKARLDPPVKGGWLGALVAVTRWVTVHDEDWTRAPYTEERSLTRGDVVAYLDDQFSGDATLFAGLTPPTAFGDGPSLLAGLAQGDDVGLVYVACHGHTQDTFLRTKLGSLALAQLSQAALGRVAGGRSVVMLNACHSGRLFVDPYLKSGVHGFCEAFLRHGASCVVGTAGEVRSTVARAVAARLLDEASGTEPLPVSEALRIARAQAVAQLS